MNPVHAATAPLIVVMGVSGSGKSTIGSALAAQLGVHFIDGDDLHPRANVEKMSRGIPLDDSDRLPWLTDIGRTLSDHRATGLVVACSALKRAYRDLIRWEAPDAVFVHADGPSETIRARLSARPDHFMPATLLVSQLHTLEPLSEAETGFTIDIHRPVDELVDETIRALRSGDHAEIQTEESTH
jgi:gluconokinase